MLVDSHCHLNFPELVEDQDGVFTRAKEAGVGLMLNISTRMSTAAETVEIAERFSQVFATVGVHPHYAEEEGAAATLEALLKWSENPRVVGIGESGLDFFYEKSPRQRQEDVFRVHIAAARETGLPLVIHSRDADDNMIRILREEMKVGAFPALLHCFSSGAQLAEVAVELGFYVSASGVVTFNRNEELRSIFKSVPLDRILVETDSPYLAPIPKRGKRNEPAFLAYTAKKMAELYELEDNEFARITTANFMRLFSKISASALEDCA